MVAVVYCWYVPQITCTTHIKNNIFAEAVECMHILTQTQNWSCYRVKPFLNTTPFLITKVLNQLRNFPAFFSTMFRLQYWVPYKCMHELEFHTTNIMPLWKIASMCCVCVCQFCFGVLHIRCIRIKHTHMFAMVLVISVVVVWNRTAISTGRINICFHLAYSCHIVMYRSNLLDIVDGTQTHTARLDSARLNSDRFSGIVRWIAYHKRNWSLNKRNNTRRCPSFICTEWIELNERSYGDCGRFVDGIVAISVVSYVQFSCIARTSYHYDYSATNAHTHIPWTVSTTLNKTTIFLFAWSRAYHKRDKNRQENTHAFKELLCKTLYFQFEKKVSTFNQYFICHSSFFLSRWLPFFFCLNISDVCIHFSYYRFVFYCGCDIWSIICNA